MLRAHLTDAAIAAAKAWSHAHVEPRHVGYAIASHLRERPEVSELLPQTRRSLEPRGVAYEAPTLTPEAVALLDSIGSPDEALRALRELLGGEASKQGVAGGAGVEAAPTEAEVAVEPAPEAPPETKETVEEVLAELGTLVGLEKVKEQVQRVIAVVQANQERAEAGLPTVNPGLHLVFSGTPGTGKTTVARLMARLYAATGALPGSNFTEVDRSDLVAGYVGQTALATVRVIQKTVPGVLFIDEAYALTPKHESDFGAEAIATLVKAMEDRRHELAIIVAGYARQMREFVETNPGLRSRLKTFIDFPDYSPEELVRIFASFADSAGLRLSDEGLAKAGDLFERAVRRTDFGNARFARSLFEDAYARMALRAAADGELSMSELMELTPEDLEWGEPGVEVNERRIGFGAVDAGAEDGRES